MLTHSGLWLGGETYLCIPLVMQVMVGVGQNQLLQAEGRLAVAVCIQREIMNHFSPGESQAHSLCSI